MQIPYINIYSAYVMINIYQKKLSKKHFFVFEENTLEEKIIGKQEKIEMFKKVQKLDEKTRNVVYLRILGDLSYKEIAEIMGKSESWTRVTFFRGKEKLKEEK